MLFLPRIWRAATSSAAGRCLPARGVVAGNGAAWCGRRFCGGSHQPDRRAGFLPDRLHRLGKLCRQSGMDRECGDWHRRDDLRRLPGGCAPSDQFLPGAFRAACGYHARRRKKCQGSGSSLDVRPQWHAQPLPAYGLVFLHRQRCASGGGQQYCTRKLWSGSGECLHAG